MNFMQFFGLNIYLDQNRYSTDSLTELIGIKNTLNKAKTVKRLSSENGKAHPIVDIAKRQLALKQLRPLLEDSLLKYDSLWYTKEVNYSSDSDRLYGAEEKLLGFALCIATGDTLKHLEGTDFKPNTQALRETPDKERFKRYWELLADCTRKTVEDYQDEAKKRTEKEPDSSRGFFSRLFKS